MSKSIAFPSPAKLNLFLHITGRQENGYHNLQTLFQILDTGDELQFEVTTSPDIELVTPIPGVPNAQNLIVKAALALQKHAKINKGCRIWLNKRLPMGGGIGGGSSNAATTLVALNKLWDLNLSSKELQSLGLKLGADVPIFVNGHSAFAEGVGEKIKNQKIPEKYYLLVNPNVHVSTADVFQYPDLPRNSKEISFEQYSFSQTHNDCQEIVCNKYPDIAKVLRWLLEYAPSRMTGTGATVFGIFEHKETAENVLQKLPSEWTGFVAKGCNKSPLLEVLQKLSAS